MKWVGIIFCIVITVTSVIKILDKTVQVDLPDPCIVVVDSLQAVIGTSYIQIDSLEQEIQLLNQAQDSLIVLNKIVNDRYENIINAMPDWSNDQHARFFSAHTTED